MCVCTTHAQWNTGDMLSLHVENRLTIAFAFDAANVDEEPECAGELCARQGGLESPPFVYQLPVDKLVPPSDASRVRELDEQHAEELLVSMRHELSQHLDNMIVNLIVSEEVR